MNAGSEATLPSDAPARVQALAAVCAHKPVPLLPRIGYLAQASLYDAG
jgi:hypothetical protein